MIHAFVSSICITQAFIEQEQHNCSGSYTHEAMVLGLGNVAMLVALLLCMSDSFLLECRMLSNSM